MDVRAYVRSLAIADAPARRSFDDPGSTQGTGRRAAVIVRRTVTSIGLLSLGISLVSLLSVDAVASAKDNNSATEKYFIEVRVVGRNEPYNYLYGSLHWKIDE